MRQRTSDAMAHPIRSRKRAGAAGEKAEPRERDRAFVDGLDDEIVRHLQRPQAPKAWTHERGRIGITAQDEAIASIATMRPAAVRRLTSRNRDPGSLPTIGAGNFSMCR